MANRVITDYILRQRQTYTREAIRESLLRKGHPPDQVDEAFRAVESGEAPPEAQLSARGWLLYAAYTLLLYVLIVAAAVLLGRLPLGMAAFVVAIFLVLAIPGVALFGAMSRSLALGLASGVILAGLIPLVVIVILGGTCVALLSAFQPPLTSTGTMSLRLDPPLAFDGSGPANCQFATDGSGIGVYAQRIGQLDGDVVGASINLFGAGNSSVSVDVSAPDFTHGVSYFSAQGGQFDVDASADWSIGRVEFEDLRSGGGPDSPPGTEAVSGTVEWECRVP